MCVIRWFLLKSCIFGMYISVTEASVTLRTFDREDTYLKDTPVTLVCKITPYNNEMTWYVDNDPYADCFLGTCGPSPNKPYTFVFDFDETAGVFNLTINSVNSAHAKLSFACDDGNVRETISFNVTTDKGQHPSSTTHTTKPGINNQITVTNEGKGDNDDSTLSDGAIAGAVIGIVCGIAIVSSLTCLLVNCLCPRNKGTVVEAERKKDKLNDRNKGTVVGAELNKDKVNDRNKGTVVGAELNKDKVNDRNKGTVVGAELNKDKVNDRNKGTVVGAELNKDKVNDRNKGTVVEAELNKDKLNNRNKGTVVGAELNKDKLNDRNKGTVVGAELNKDKLNDRNIRAPAAAAKNESQQQRGREQSVEENIEDWIKEPENCCIIMQELLGIKELLWKIVKEAKEVLVFKESAEQERELMRKREEWIKELQWIERQEQTEHETIARSKMQELVKNRTFSSHIMKGEGFSNFIMLELQKNTDKYKKLQQGIEKAKQDHTKMNEGD